MVYRSDWGLDSADECKRNRKFSLGYKAAANFRSGWRSVSTETGKSDLLWRNSPSGDTYILLMDRTVIRARHSSTRPRRFGVQSLPGGSKLAPKRIRCALLLLGHGCAEGIR